MANVTYLMGAGASAYCLPTYINFFERFKEFGRIFTHNSEYVLGLDDSQKKDAANIREKITKIGEEFQFHSTPDTIAKKYFHSYKQDELNNLKEILILFFLFEQILNGYGSYLNINDPTLKQSVDKRYDAFISGLLKPLKGKLEILNQFKILTWNYDLQFEIVYSRYRSQSIIQGQKNIQSFPTILTDTENFDPDKFCIIHLNGIAYARADSSFGNKDFLGTFHDLTTNVLSYLIDVYHSMRTFGMSDEIGGSRLLSFAWEKQNDDFTVVEDELFNKAKQIAQNTQILVIIGYSFPIFNNPIDKLLFKEMHNLNKIFIQSPNADEIKNILLSDFISDGGFDPIEIMDVGYWSQFHIPSEWNKTLKDKVIGKFT